ncbi:DUF255-domain-containing protein [Calocera cornea HHB12733]|uniref:DUF255-domain-containing protein n=1 Tax=Calocera cornea HHB12733 TaxID=1353952 RepID=A0A165ESQ4_9BASI|nr:DUF255-domain-containing protein [Calocera cornea HHB12733]
MAHQGTPNRLINESSPYLRQHAYNPVDWYPWSDEAFEKAKAEDKPVFLSIGYSTCRWCHVMERESFENEEVAKMMNDVCVNVKVDREVLPDVDRVYMNYVTAITGRGGWPMSVWITPDTKVPFFGGTYFPPEAMEQILGQIKDKWKTARDRLVPKGDSLSDILQEPDSPSSSNKGILDPTVLRERCLSMFERIYDKKNGGFGGAPKFPTESIFSFLHTAAVLNEENTKALEMSGFTLKKMAMGGIHDQIGLGFHRYSVDAIWHIPHFELMLYDNAQLAYHYLTYYALTRDEYYRNIAIGVLSYLDRVLLSKGKAYMSAEDAESYEKEGDPVKKEGAFYVWTIAQINALLGEEDGAVFCQHFGVKDEGNVEEEHDPHRELQGKNVLMEQATVEETAKALGKSMNEVEAIIVKGKAILSDEREKRPKPHLDDKLIASWNGLMLKTFAHAAIQLQGAEGDRLYEQGVAVAKFIQNEMMKDGKLLRCYGTNVQGVSEDYGCVVNGLLALYQVKFDTALLQLAVQLQEKQDELFWDDKDGGYFASSADSDASKIMKLKDDHDGQEPSSNSISLHNLITLDSICHATDPALLNIPNVAESSAERYGLYAAKMIAHFTPKLLTQPASMPEMVCATLLHLKELKCVILSSPDREQAQDFAAKIRETDKKKWRPDTIYVWEKMEKFEGVSGRVCAGKTCGMPSRKVEDVIKELDNVY